MVWLINLLCIYNLSDELLCNGLQKPQKKNLRPKSPCISFEVSATKGRTTQRRCLEKINLVTSEKWTNSLIITNFKTDMRRDPELLKIFKL